MLGGYTRLRLNEEAWDRRIERCACFFMGRHLLFHENVSTFGKCICFSMRMYRPFGQCIFLWESCVTDYMAK